MKKFIGKFNWENCFPNALKLLRVMKLTTALIMISTLSLLASESYSQTKKLTLKMKDAKVEDVLVNIEKQSEFYFFIYSERVIDVERKVSLDIENETIETVLNDIFAETNVAYSIKDRLIILSTPELIGNTAQAVWQQATVSGKVTDSGGQPLPGVSIVVKGTTQGTVTNADGEYTLTNIPPDATLVFSFVGMRTQEIEVDNQTNINVTMEEEVVGIEEVVAIGYGTQKKVNLTGAVSQVLGEKLDNRVLTSAIEGLKGQVAGLEVYYSGAGGEPGATSSFQIRGEGSLSGGSPYIVVDGMPQDLSTVNPRDIESISVLKGAAASAIYGSRAPYGVILVTTKKGQAKEDLKITYSGNIGWNTPTVIPDKANSLQWVETYNEAAVNAGQSPLFSDETIQRIKQYMQDPENTPGTVVTPGFPNDWDRFNGPGLGYYANANVDYYDEFYRDLAMNQTHNISVRGGSEMLTYYFSGGVYNMNGQMNYGDDKFRRINLMSNVHTDITKWLGLDINTKFSNWRTDTPASYAGSNTANYFHDLARRYPTIPIFDPNGHFLNRSFAVNALGGRGIDMRNQLVGLFKFNINPLAGWDINADFNYRTENLSGSNHEKEVLGYYVDETTFPISGTTPTEFSTYENRREYYTSNIYTSYEFTVNKHFFKALAGFQAEEFNYHNLSGRRINLITDEVPSLSTATGEDYTDDDKGHWATEGVFMRLQYNYAEKYLFEVNGRYDGSSRFEEGKRWGLFPSVSAGYNIAREPFWEQIRDEVSMLKIRAAYGSLGNHDVANYLYIPTLGVNSSYPWLINGSRQIAVYAPGLISSDLSWETSSTFELGLDTRMLASRLSMTIDWFRRLTTDMFGPAATYPAVLGTSPPRENNANLKTTGFEISVGWRDQIGQVKYNVRAMLSDYQSTVTKYRNDRGYIYDYYEGQKLGEIWGYTTEGLYQSDEEAQNDPEDQSFFYSTWRSGDVNYKDLNGDGKVNNGNQTLDDHGDLSIIGNSTPRYSYSLDLGLEWKGIDFSMLWQGVAKQDMVLTGSMFWGFGSSPGNRNSIVLKQHLDYWRPDNTDAYYPRPYMIWDEGSKNQNTQTRYLQSSAYLRLQNLQIGYTLPREWLNWFGELDRVKIYFTGENLMVFSPIMESYDPEVVRGRSNRGGLLYPLAKTLSSGLIISF